MAIRRNEGPIRFLAMIYPDDMAHVRAQAASRQKMGRYVTSDWIITEVADAMSKGRARQKVGGLVSHLRASPVWEIVPFSETLFNHALEYRSRFHDKEWTLTDCTSFLIMQERGITEALTGDCHFEQAGFVALLK
jgi:predicted nucleic acid-binding protein